MTQTSMRLSSYAFCAWGVAVGVLAFGAGCELVVPSDAELTGGSDKPDGAAPESSTPFGDGGDAGDAAPPSGGVTLVQQMGSSATSTSSLVVTLPSAPQTGNALILTIAAFSTGATPTFTVSGGGVTWSAVSLSSAHIVTALWAGFRAASGTRSITVTASSSQSSLIAHVSEWSGGLTSSGTPLKSNGGSTPATATLTAGDGTALIYAAAGTHALPLAAPSNGFVALPTVTAGTIQIVEAYRLAPPAGTYSTAWAETPPSGNGWDAHIVSFAR